MKFVHMYGTRHHYITRDGYIYSDIEKRIIDEERENDPLISVRENEILFKMKLSKLLMYSFYGKSNLKIMNIDPGSDINIDTLEYQYKLSKVTNEGIYLDSEFFKRHPMYTDIYININGVVYVYQYNRQKFIKWKFPTQYPAIHIKRKNHMVHRLVYETHIGKIPEDLVINHMDLMKNNPSIENLEVVSIAQNNAHSREFHLQDEYWSDEIVHVICGMLEKGMHSRDIAMTMGYSSYKDIKRISSRISSILKKEYYHEISSNYDFSNYEKYQGRKLTELKRDDALHETCKLLAYDKELSDLEISRITGIEGSTIRYIRLGKNGKWSKRITDLYEIDPRTRSTVGKYRKFNNDEIREIRGLLDKGYSLRKIEALVNVGKETIRSIKNGVAYADVP